MTFHDQRIGTLACTAVHDALRALGSASDAVLQLCGASGIHAQAPPGAASASLQHPLDRFYRWSVEHNDSPTLPELRALLLRYVKLEHVLGSQQGKQLAQAVHNLTSSVEVPALYRVQLAWLIEGPDDNRNPLADIALPRRWAQVVWARKAQSLPQPTRRPGRRRRRRSALKKQKQKKLQKKSYLQEFTLDGPLYCRIMKQWSESNTLSINSSVVTVTVRNGL